VLTLLTLIDRLNGIPANMPVFDSFAQGRSMARALAETALSVAAIVLVAAALLGLRWHLGLA
jgi:hypothetical protein